MTVLRPLPKKAAHKEKKQGILTVNRLYKCYTARGIFKKGRYVEAAKEVTFRLMRKEVLGIVGESGSGKSTVARCIARLVDPTSGQILIRDRDISKAPQSHIRKERQKFQIIFQDPCRSLNPRRTVGQSIVEGMTNFDMPKNTAWQRAKELLALVGLAPNAIDRYPHQFSGGQRQRVCIARALAVNPELLIADEPVSALDVSVQAQVLALLDEIQAKFNLSMLFITHDLRVAAQVCDWVAVMFNGKIVEYGPTREIFQNPQHDYTRVLLAAAPGKHWRAGNNASESL